MHRAAPLAATALACLAGGLSGCGDEPAAAGPDRFDGPTAMADVRAQVAIGPRAAGTDGGRREVEWIRQRLEDEGLDSTVQEPWRNVVASIPGTEPGWIVVGAHHDTLDGIPEFAGANDGASGVAVVLGLGRALGPQIEGSGVQLVLFDAEEARPGLEFADDGMRGSDQYVEYAAAARQGALPIDEIRSMVLFDMVGDCDLQIPREGKSDAALYQAFADAAAARQDGDPAPFDGKVTGVLDDHIPFTRAGIPAVDLIDFTYGGDESPGDYWHTDQDVADHVCEESLDTVGEAAVGAIERIAAG